MRLNGLEEPLPEAYVFDCIDLLKEIITGETSAMITDRP